MLKMLLLSITLAIAPQQSYEVVKVTNNLITIDVNGQLENWYIEGYNNIEAGDQVVILRDRLVEVE